MMTKKFFLTLLIPFLLALSAIQFGNPRPALAASPFVVTSGTSFILNGKDFYFAGTNNYYFHYKSKKMSDDVFEDIRAMNLKVIRICRFLDAQPQENTVMQPEPVMGDESVLSRLDYAI